MDEFKLNQKVKVELTLVSEAILSITDATVPEHHPPDAENKRTFLLWELMAVFGPGLCIGGQSPFVNGIIWIIADE